LIESIWMPPTSSAKRQSRRGVRAAARGRARCWRCRKSARIARGEAGVRGIPAETIIGREEEDMEVDGDAV
jgi:hypothetical protein